MALSRLRGELKAIGVTQAEAGSFLDGMTASNFNRKLAESVPFTRDEMFRLRDKYFPDRSIDYLFESDGNVPSKAESLHAQVDAMGDQLRYANPEADGVEEIEGMFHELANEWERQCSEEE